MNRARRKSGQLMVEFSLLSIIAWLPISFFLLAFSAGLFIDHLLFIDATTMSRARLYDLSRPCELHSFWPQKLREHMSIDCRGAHTRLTFQLWKIRLQQEVGRKTTSRNAS